MSIIINKEDDCYRLDSIIQNYNWDDGFDAPRKVIDHKNCELGTALRAFYLAEGDLYLTNKIPENMFGTEWYQFLNYLFRKIIAQDYSGRYIHFQMPFTKVQIYKLKKYSPPIDPIFFSEIEGSTTAERCEECFFFNTQHGLSICPNCSTPSLGNEINGSSYHIHCVNCNFSVCTTIIRPCALNRTAAEKEFVKYRTCSFKEINLLTR